MLLVNIHAAKTHLSSLVSKAAAGESFVIAKAGHPLVTVNPYTEVKTGKRIGFLKGNISVPHDFDSMGSGEIVEMFEGKV
jgi:antitoxin (DNA-binding transcriptional repressor) of toxin-antitoxin stability system